MRVILKISILYIILCSFKTYNIKIIKSIASRYRSYNFYIVCFKAAQNMSDIKQKKVLLKYKILNKIYC